MGRLGVVCLVALVACGQPHVVLTIEGPESVSETIRSIALGTMLDDLTERDVTGLPVTLSVIGQQDTTATLSIEGYDAGNALQARGSLEVTFRRSGPRNVVTLGIACDAAADCDDGIFCNGEETCTDGVCVTGDDPCGSAFECVVRTCLEDADICDTDVDHELCPPVDLGEGPVERYCDTAAGCTRGQPCNDVDLLCPDTSACNGVEQCVAGRCVAGAPPEPDDGNPCTIDACLEPDGVVNLPDATRDGAACTLQGGGAGICNDGVCAVSTCGDGLLDETLEQCEDGNDDPNDGCDACRFTTWNSSVLVGLPFAGGDPLQTPMVAVGMVSDRAGNVFVADGRGSRILRLDAATGIATYIAGNGSGESSGNGGPATAAGIDLSSIWHGMAVDGFGNVFFEDRASVRRVDANTGTITSVGNGIGGFWGLSAGALAVDGGGIAYVVDLIQCRVRRFDPVTLLSEAVMGTGVCGWNGDGLEGTQTQLNFPTDIAIAANGDIYVSDSGNNRVRVLAADTGLVSTVAGNGDVNPSGDGGLALNAGLGVPAGIEITPDGQLFISTTTNVRRVELSTGVIDAWAGGANVGWVDGAAADAQFGNALRLSQDGSGALFVLDLANAVVRRVAAGQVTTHVGSGQAAFAGAGLVGTALNISKPSNLVSTDHGLRIASDGSLIIADIVFDVIRRLDATSQVISIVGGNTTDQASVPGELITESPLRNPKWLTYDNADNLFFLEGSNIRRADALTGVLTDVANAGAALQDIVTAPDGQIYVSSSIEVFRLDGGALTSVAGGGATNADGILATSALLTTVAGIAFDSSGNLLIVEIVRNKIRRVDMTTNLISTIAGDGTPNEPVEGALAMGGPLNGPNRVVVDANDNIYVTELAAGHVHRIDALTGAITLVAGGGAGEIGDGGPGASAHLDRPAYMDVDGDSTLYIAEADRGRVRALDLQTGMIRTVFGGENLYGVVDWDNVTFRAPSALLDVDGKWLVTQGVSGQIHRFDPEASTVERVAGYEDGFVADGAEAGFARAFIQPEGIAYRASTQTYYVSEASNHTIRAIDASTTPWTVQTILGTDGIAGFADGAWSAAVFSSPRGLAFDSATDTLYVADSGNHVVRAIDVAGQTVTTVAGIPQEVGIFGENVPATSAQLNGPSAVVVAPDGGFYISDTGSHKVRRVRADQNIETVLGDGTNTSSGSGSPARQFPVAAPLGMSIDSRGNLFVASSTSVREVRSGEDGIATGDDEVVTVYGAPPRDAFPESSTFCVSDVLVTDGAAGEVDGRVLVLDACQGLLLAVERESL